MMSTTIANKNRPGRLQVLIISLTVQVVFVGGLWLATPLRTSNVELNLSELEEKAVEVQNRNRDRIEEERLRRKNTEIKSEDAEKLKKAALKKEKQKVVEVVREMREIKKSILESRKDSFEELKKRGLDQVNQNEMNDLLAIADEIVEQAFHLKARLENTFPLAKSTHPAALQLRENTIEFARQAEWSARGPLAEQALSIGDPLRKRLREIPEADDNSDFRLFAGGVVENVDLFLAALDRLLTTNAELAELNNLGDFDQTDSQAGDDAGYPESLEELGLEELVNEAVTLEQDISDDYNQLRAAEIAQIENISFMQAMDKVATAISPSSNVDLTGEDTSRSTDAGSESSGELANENGNSQSLNGNPQNGQNTGANSSTWMPGAKGAAGNAGKTTVGDVQNYRSELAGMRQQAIGRWTSAMNMAQQVGAFRTRNQVGRSKQAFQSNAGGMAGGSRGNTPTAGANGSGGDGWSVVSRGNSAETGTQFRSKSPLSGLQFRHLRIPADSIKAKALPGRRFRKDSMRQGWLFLDTWYIIGPWENNGQLDYQKTHPPEIEVDLDAEYPDGKRIHPNSAQRHPLSWQFVQSDFMRITPPNEQARSTYYAYTEVYFDEPANMLVAIATDDAARMWVNDRLVWEDEGQSGWNLDEGFRVISFKQGFNKFLVRIENSPILCEFSVLLCPPNQVDQ